MDFSATAAERKLLAKQRGVTGESILYQLYDLCKFDPVYDLVVDALTDKEQTGRHKLEG